MITAACATDDEKNFINRHFGDAESYAIYQFNGNGFHYVKTIKNITIDSDEDKEHGDALKAKHVMLIMKELGVDIVINKNFGPNINRIKLKFLPVITKEDSIESALKSIAEKITIINEEFAKGSARNPFILDNAT